MTREIQLTKGYVAIVDDEDFVAIASHRWHAVRTSAKRVYAIRHTPTGRRGGGPRVYMHRQILGLTDNIRCDHVNGDGLDNRRENLRAATQRQNMQNRRTYVPPRSGYRGVAPSPHGNKWTARVTVNRKAILLGSYETPEEAALARDAAARLHFGEFARLNFPTPVEQGAFA